MELSELAPWIAIAITLALSILVPLFTQIANNRHQIKMQREKFAQEQSQKKYKAYEDFLMQVGGAITHAKSTNLDVAGSCLYQVYLYCPTEWYEDLDKLSTLIREYHWDKATIIMQKLSKLMAEELRKK